MATVIAQPGVFGSSTKSTAKRWGAEFHADALALAAEQGHLAIVRLLIKAGAALHLSVF